jgi:hypothetical protein
MDGGRLARALESMARHVGRRLPPRLQAFAEYYGRRGARASWGGPFNGQARRQEIVRQLFETLDFTAVVETGTYRGTTTEFLVRETGLPVYTVEAAERFYHYSRLRLRRYKQAHLHLGDSRNFLGELGQGEHFPAGRAFFYLDAHWYADLPLADEVDIIRARWRQFVIMVDDFEVSGDAGYSFDDYGEGKRLSLELFPDIERQGLGTFFPAARSSEETGMRRGCVVLADRQSSARVERLSTLRRFR